MTDPAAAQRRARSTGKLTVGKAILAESERPGVWRFKPEVLRLREIERIVWSRHGAMVPETDDACLYLEAVHLAGAGQDLAAWCRMWAPWMRAIPDLPPLGRRMQSADACARLLNVTLAERTALGLRTIGACDVTKAERAEIAKAAKRERDRERAAQRRNAAGRKDRESYEAESLQSTRPWVALGISRRTWFRRRGTTVSRLESIKRGGDAPVPFTDSVPAMPGSGGAGGSNPLALASNEGARNAA